MHKKKKSKKKKKYIKKITIFAEYKTPIMAKNTKSKKMSTERQTKHQWISIVILAVIEVLTKLNII